MKPYIAGFRPNKASVKRTLGLLIISLIINIPAKAGGGNTRVDSLGVRTVIIDPGHGGSDPGCLGAHSHEADVALAISLKLGKMLTDKYGDALNVVYTRTTDIHVGLAERAKMANQKKGDLFICIHANSGPSHAKGSETYVLGLHKEDAQFKVAQKENSAILMEKDYETKYENFNPNDPESYIILNYMAKTYLANSILFADKIQANLKNTPKVTDRGVKQAGFLVLHQVNMPSVLVETAFLTNKAEEEMLNDEQFQTDIAKGMFNAFVEYKTEVEGRNKINGNDVATDKNTTTIDKNTTTDKNTTVNDNNSTADKNTTTDKNTNNTAQTAVDKNTTSTQDKNTTTDKNTTADNDKDKVYFKVQIAANGKPIELKPQNFKGLDGIEEHTALISGKTMYRYTYGKTHNFEEAKKFQTVAQGKGFNSAFITAYLNGEKIEMSRAMELANK